ncbi:hypothetical protein ACVR1G_02195 [Streptococcus dentasini]
MNQKEWIELFQSVNGRKPTKDELVAAAKAGVIANGKNQQPAKDAAAKGQKKGAVFSRPPVDEPAWQSEQHQQSQTASRKEVSAKAKKSTKTTQAGQGQMKSPSASKQQEAYQGESSSLNQQTSSHRQSPQNPKQTVPNASQQAAANPSGQPIRRASFGGVHRAPNTAAQPTQPVNASSVQAATAQDQQPFRQQGQSVSQAQKKAKWPKVLAALVALIFLGLAGLGSYAWWRNDSGNIQGTWQLTKWDYYNKEEGSWMNVLKQYEDSDYTYVDFITVDADKSFQEDSYYYDNDYPSRPYLSLGSYLDNAYRVNQWDKKVEIPSSAKAYRQKVSNILKTELKGYYDYLDTANVNDDIDSITDTYDYTRHYKKKDNTLTITTQDKNGRTISKAVYRRLSSSKAKKLTKTFQNIRQKFEKNYHIK